MEGWEYLLKRAAKGDANAQFHYGLHLHLKKDYTGAKHQYELAARKEQPDALNNLGLLLQTGSGIAQSLELAESLFAEAANLGHCAASYNLGAIYYLRRGPNDAEKAFKYVKAAADLGYPRACYLLGRLYSEGAGTNKDFESASMYLAKAYELEPTIISDEEKVNREHGLIQYQGSSLPTIPSYRVEKMLYNANAEAESFLQRVALIPNVPPLGRLDERLRKAVMTEAKAVVKAYRSAIAGFGRNLLSLNKPLGKLDQAQADFLKLLSSEEVPERLQSLFRARDLIYEAALLRNIPFFTRLGEILGRGADNKVVSVDGLKVILLDSWLNPKEETPPFCFFTNDALVQFVNLKFKSQFRSSSIVDARKNLGLVQFKEPWFHVKSADLRRDGVIALRIVPGRPKRTASLHRVA